MPESVKKKAGFTDVTEDQRFLGFANFYRRFIKAYSRVVAPLAKLTGKDGPFAWSPACQAAVDRLKQAFTTAPALRHFDHDREIIVETDASDFVSAGEAVDSETVLEFDDHFHSCIDCGHIEKLKTLNDYNFHKAANEWVYFTTVYLIS